MKSIGWGIIGCGNVTEVKSGPAFNRVAGSSVVAVMCRSEERAKAYTFRHAVSAWYTRAEEILQDTRVSAIYVATPPQSHADFAIMALQAGKPVYVEKPMAAKYADCIRMNEMADSLGLPLYVAYYRRFLPYFIKVKELLDSSVLGDLLFVRLDFAIPPRVEDWNRQNLPWRVLPDISGGGYFHDLACHQLDLFEWFFGKAVCLNGYAVNRRHLYDPPDMVSAHLLFESGLPLFASWCFAAGDERRTDLITIFGSRGSLEFSTFEFSPIRHIRNNQVEEFLPANPVNIQYGFIRNMVEELQGMRPLSCNGKVAAETSHLMEQILSKHIK